MMDLSPEPKKKIKKAKLSKSVAGKKLSKEAILNRMSSGKKRPKSETKIKKGQKTPTKEDLVAKKLLFQDDSDEDDLRQSPVKLKKKLDGGSVSKKSGSVKKAQSSTSKWEVSEAKPSALKQQKVRKEQDIDSNNMGKEIKEPSDIDIFEVDAEIDFPVLKRKSLGLGELKLNHSEKKSPKKQAKVLKKVAENGQSKKKSKMEKGKTVSEDSSSDSTNKDEGVEKGKRKKKKSEDSRRDSTDNNEGEEKGKRKKKRKRGKKRHSESETEEPKAKKEKTAAGESFAVRCGNLPPGASKTALRMFIGEADVFPTSIIMKRHRKSGRNEKKMFLRYATILCSSAEEADKLCKLNGITMPSPLGSGSKNLLIHRIDVDGSSQDHIMKRKLFIGNLHVKAKEEDLMDFFEKVKCHPTNIIIPKKGSEQTSRGYAFVYMESGGDVERALKLKNPTLKEKMISIARSKTRHSNAQEP